MTRSGGLLRKMATVTSHALPVGSESPASIIGWSRPASPTRQKRLEAQQMASVKLQAPVAQIKPQAQPDALLFDPLPGAMSGIVTGKKQRRGAAGPRAKARKLDMVGGPSALLCGAADGSSSRAGWCHRRERGCCRRRLSAQRRKWWRAAAARLG